MQDSDLLLEVDENDQPIGGIARKLAKATGRRHRVVRIILEDEDGHTLIQKRTLNKDAYPGCWENAAAGHVDLGDDYDTAARRELSEEVGVEGIELKEVDYHYEETVNPAGHLLNRFIKLYIGKVPHDTEFRLEPSEVSEVKWVTVDELRQIAEDESQISDGLLDTYQLYYRR